MSDWEYSDSDCPKCGEMLVTRRCTDCEDGELLELDPLWPVTEKCDRCNGKGYEEWCRRCGWDVNYNQFLSPQYEAKWRATEKAKREAGK